MKTILYIDGFNLFYSALKGTALRWLNPVAMIQRAFPRNQIIGTKYFTAKVSALPNNPGQPIRQMIFWRALRTLPDLEIIEGDFRTREVMAAVVNPPPSFMKKPVGVLNPQRLSGPNCRPPRKNAGLQQAATFYQNGVTWAQLLAAQFPNTLTDAVGAFHKPATWV